MQNIKFEAYYRRNLGIKKILLFLKNLRLKYQEHLFYISTDLILGASEI